MRLSTGGSWVLFLAALFIVAAWPPQQGRSLIVKTMNWAVDPSGSLPVLPPQLGFGQSDDVMAVEERDAQVRHYDELYARKGFTRTRLLLKVAEDPFDRATERQWLLVFGVVVTFVVLRRQT